VAGRASIVGAAATHVGKVRDHNEDAHFIDAERGLFVVCDGMGGHAAGEVASELAIRSIRHEWASDALREVAEQWLERGTPEARKRLIEVVRAGVLAAHNAILDEADRDDTKSGMGTTLVGAMIVGGELVFAHAGDSRAYLVRDGIAMQLTEDHTLLARLLAAGIDVDVTGEGSRFRSMLTNALGIGEECKVSTFAVPLADGDRFLLCSDGISEYIPENEVGDILTKQTSPARAAQQLIDLALERGGGDNATAVVVRVLEAGETPLPAEQRTRDDVAIGSCALWGRRVTPQQRLRALRIAIPRDHSLGDKLPPHALGDRVAWIVIEGELVQDGQALGPGAFVYPESLIAAGPAGEVAPLPDRDALAAARSDVRALAIRADDFRELCNDDGELGEALLESLAQVLAKRTPRASTRAPTSPIDPRAATDPQLRAVTSREIDAYQATDPQLRVASGTGGHAKAKATAEAEPAPRPARGSRRSQPPAPRPGPAPESAARATAATVPPPIAAAPPPPIAAAPPPPIAAAPPAPPPIAAAPPAPPPIAAAPAVRSPPAPARSQASARAAAPARSPTPARGPAPVRGEPRAKRPGATRARKRPPSEPDIEAYVEIEADLPPAAGFDPDRESELAMSLALGIALDEDPKR
jgi:protein phosphatase